jgi:tetratricopeptide (TPR) repeat protein
MFLQTPYNIHYKAMRIVLLVTAFTILGFYCSSFEASASKDGQAVMSSDNEPLVYANFCTGFYLMLEQEWEEAIKFFHKALDFNPKAEKIHDLLATCYFKLNKND